MTKSLPESMTNPLCDHDPRWVYDLTTDQTRSGWPCVFCGIRRDEHADQPEQSSFPSLDITDHEFVECDCGSDNV